MTYRLPRPGAVDLCFEGRLLASVTSQENGESKRWTEIRIYRTDTNRWVTEQIGRTTVRGETTRRKVTLCDTPDEVRISLRRTYTIEYLTNLALEALDQAAEQDDDLKGLTSEWV